MRQILNSIALVVGCLILVCDLSNADDMKFGLYLSLYKVDRGANHMSKGNKLHEAFRTSDFDQIVKEASKDGFDRIFILTGSELVSGVSPAYPTKIKGFKQHEAWASTNRDPVEEILKAADKYNMDVVFSALSPWVRAADHTEYWQQQNLLGKDKTFTHDLERATEKVVLPAARELIQNYKKYQSFSAIGSDEIHYRWADPYEKTLSNYFWGPEINQSRLVNVDDLLFTKAGYELLNLRDDKMTNFHRQLAALATSNGVGYFTTLNRSMISKMIVPALGGESSIAGVDTWDIMSIPNIEIGFDFYRRKLWSNIFAHVVKLFATYDYIDNLNAVVSARTTTDVLFFETLLAFAEGINLITYWTDYYYFGDKDISQRRPEFNEPLDRPSIQHMIKVLRQFNAKVERAQNYQIGIIPLREWARSHYLSRNIHTNEVVALNAVVDSLNSGGYTYDILFPKEVSLQRLKRYGVVILPFAKGIGDRELGAIEAYVREGGKLICFGEIGRATPWNKRRKTTEWIDEMLPVKRKFLSTKLRPRIFRMQMQSEETFDLHPHKIRMLAEPKEKTTVLGQAKTRWGDLASPHALVEGQYHKGKVIYSLVAAHRYKKSIWPSVLMHLGVESRSPLRPAGWLPKNLYDAYWAVSPYDPIPAGVFDRYWEGDRYRGFSMGYRSGRQLRKVDFENLRFEIGPQDFVLAGKTATSDFYDLFLTTSPRRPKPQKGFRLSVEAEQLKLKKPVNLYRLQRR